MFIAGGPFFYFPAPQERNRPGIGTRWAAEFRSEGSEDLCVGVIAINILLLWSEPNFTVVLVKLNPQVTKMRYAMLIGKGEEN